MAKSDTSTWTGFLIVAFGVVGLIGAFATYAANIPFDRAVARNHTLDQVLQAARAADPKPAMEALRPLLAESAGRVLDGAGPLEPRVTAERSRMLGELHDQAQDYGVRLRVVIAAFTGAAALFGAMVLSIVRRA